MLLFPYIKKNFIYLYVRAAVHANVLAGVGIGILECEYRGINFRGPGYH